MLVFFKNLALGRSTMAKLVLTHPRKYGQHTLELVGFNNKVEYVMKEELIWDELGEQCENDKNKFYEIFTESIIKMFIRYLWRIVQRINVCVLLFETLSRKCDC